MSDDRAGAVFQALADPTRRRVVEALARDGEATASGLAAELPISRQAVTKHLVALRDAGLAESTPAGREVRYRLTPEPLDDAVAWIARTNRAWGRRLGRLREAAES